jgi:RNA polymerase primary sigma factor
MCLLPFSRSKDSGGSRNGRQDIIQKVIELGRLRGFVTFDQLNELLPSATTEPEDIEVLMEALRDEGINLIDEDQS